MMIDAKLVVVGGDAKISEVALHLPTTIGRSREADLKVPHPLVSRQHCEIFERDGELFVRDLGSLNGTYVNNQRIDQEFPLRPNQLLTLGAVTFRAVYQPNGKAPTAPATPVAPNSIERKNQPSVLPGAEGFARFPAPATLGNPANAETDLLATLELPQDRPESVDALAFEERLATPASPSVSLSAIDELPHPPAALSFAGGIQTGGDPPPPDLSSSSFPPLKSDGHTPAPTAKARPR